MKIEIFVKINNYFILQKRLQNIKRIINFSKNT